jgi:hypothetical protein
MQNTMGQDLINKSLRQIGLAPRNTNIRNLINESYYFGYKWKDRLDRFTNYTHSRPMYKLIINENSYILNKIATSVVLQDFKIISIDIYMCDRQYHDLQLTSDYQDNISIVEKYMLDGTHKNKVCKYEFKILENETIFSVMDASYNIIKKDGILESSDIDGYLKSSINISSLLEDFIIPGSG